MLDGLFATFVFLQIAVLFGGRDHVVRTAGLTFAEYARNGFFQLVAVAALTLGVVAALAWCAERKSRRDILVLQVLAGILVVLTLVVLASALKRLLLYEDAFGFTRLRVAVHAVILWMGGLFVLIAIAGVLRKVRWLAPAAVAYSAVALLVFTVAGSDYAIAERNIDRFRATGKMDVVSLSQLGADAVPALSELPEPYRSCALRPIAQELREYERSLWSFNFGRDRALEVLANDPVAAAAPCPSPSM
jgi:hypothetical protein